MKTSRMISNDTLIVAILLAMLMTFSVCSCNHGDSKEVQQRSNRTQKSRKPPKTDIHTAALLGDLDAIHRYIEAGSDLDSREAAGGSTALITAAVFGRTEVARALIEAGADLDLKNNDGSTALYCAAFFCRTEIVEALLEHGADKDVQNNYGLIACESVAGPFHDVKGIYDVFSKELGPYGLKLDYGYLEETRPKIAEMLK